ncbi:MAG TPA: peptidyl-prolyl cis-trans isomerase [Bryobacteraceae bacterium]|nr:peptidyl-prolyl cis-trans isomerase [Bryobacteraceae bacterium]
MKYHITACTLLLASVGTLTGNDVRLAPAPKPPGRPVARVNGVVLTDGDLLREMYAIFPYARQHNAGFPKAMEADIRQGALKMIVFEELVYQDALRRKMTVAPDRMRRALADFRKQFNPDQYRQLLQSEFGGSTEILQKKVQRSLLIEQMLSTEVAAKAVVSTAEAKTYYDKHPERFRIPESFALQTISIVPPPNATPPQLAEARKRADKAFQLAKAAKTYEEFGLLAQKLSEDDYRVMMGDHKAADRDKLPPAVVDAALALKPGQMSGLIHFDQIYTIVRLNAHIASGMQKFEAVKDSLRKDLEKKKTEQLRSGLNKRLRANAKVEEL